jgi:hypothetical protein
MYYWKFEIDNLFELIFYVVITISEKHPGIIFNLMKIEFKIGICKKLNIKGLKLKNIWKI